MKNIKGVISFLFLLVLLSVSEISYGQGGPGNANAGAPGNANAGAPGNANAGGPGNANAGAPGNANAGGGGPVNIPVDGGLTIFLGLGAAYGAKRIYDVVRNKERKTE